MYLLKNNLPFLLAIECNGQLNTRRSSQNRSYVPPCISKINQFSTHCYGGLLYLMTFPMSEFNVSFPSFKSPSA